MDDNIRDPQALGRAYAGKPCHWEVDMEPDPGREHTTDDREIIASVVPWDYSETGKDAFVYLCAVRYLTEQGATIPPELMERFVRNTVALHKELGDPAATPDLQERLLRAIVR